MPELPEARRQRFIKEYDLSPEDALTLTSSRALGDYYETVVKVSGNHKLAANWVLSELLRELNNSNISISDCKVTSENLGKMIGLIENSTISGKIAKDVFAEMWTNGGDPETIINDKGWVQITDTSAIEKIVDEVIANNPEQVENYKAGKVQLMGFFVGQVLKASGGKANPQAVNEIVKTKLG